MKFRDFLEFQLGQIPCYKRDFGEKKQVWGNSNSCPAINSISVETKPGNFS